jgi:type II secretion system protein G
VLKNIIKKEGGFTLLELLIVIVIIGILALLIIPNITSAPKKARDTTRKTDLRAVQKGLEEYFVSNNIYPSASNWQTDLTSGTAPIMKAVPNDPKNASPYVYTYTPANSDTTYTLTACLENASDSGTNTVAAVSPCTTKTFQLVNNN